MSTTLLTIIIAVCAVALFALGMSITLIVKGHHIKSEVSENENMRKLGIKCAVQQMREADGGGKDCAVPGADCSTTDCGSCTGGSSSR